MEKKKYIQKLALFITFISINILFANWSVNITAEDVQEIGTNHTISFGYCEECSDNWKYGEDQYDYPNPPSVQFTNIHFFNLEWFGQSDINGNVCNGTAFSSDYRAIHPSQDLVIWNIRGLTGNGLPTNIPINLKWENNEINNIPDEYEIFIYVGENGYSMRQYNNIIVNQEDLYLNGIETNINIIVGACASSGTTTHYYDVDGDGWGSNQEEEFCEGYAPAGWVTNNLDLNDEIYCLSNELDCTGVLCGSIILDDCGICGGNNLNKDCAGVCNGRSITANLCIDHDNDQLGTPNSNINTCIELPETNNLFIDNNGTVFYNSNVPIYGFQFDIVNSSILNAFGGDAELNDFMISTNSSTIIAFSLTSSPIPTGSGVLVQLNLDSPPTSLNNIVISDSTGIPINFSLFELEDIDLVIDCSDEYPDCDANYFDCLNECGGSAIIDECGICGGEGPDNGYTCNGTPELLVYNSSTLQAFYFINSVTIDNENINENDWIGAFKEDVCVGARRWSDCGGNTCEVPIMGNDGTEFTQGYMNNGEIPQFKIFDSSVHFYYNATSTDDIPWSNMDINIIDNLEVTTISNYCLELHGGANLISFYGLPEDNSISNVMASIENNVTGIISEGGACFLSPIGWLGNCSLNREKGYWIILQEDDELCFNEALPTDLDIIYDLHEGANLISFPSPGSISTSEAIPDNIENSISGMIMEGGACTQSPIGWIGQCMFNGGKGYWIITYEDVLFSYDLSSLSRTDAKNFYGLNYPTGFEIKQSTKQAFYFIKNVIINNHNINDGWILAYYNNQLIGARELTGNLVDIPVMGNDKHDYSSEYINSGQKPLFVHYNEFSGIITHLEQNNIPKWENNTIYILGTLEEAIEIPTTIQLNVFPNPFNPLTNISLTIPMESFVEVSIYNITGQKIEQLFSDFINAGTYKYTWNAYSHPSGVYFAKIKINDLYKSQKLILIK